MSDKHSFSSDNFYVGSDNVRCPTVILSTDGMKNFLDKCHFVVSDTDVYLVRVKIETINCLPTMKL